MPIPFIAIGVLSVLGISGYALYDQVAQKGQTLEAAGKLVGVDASQGRLQRKSVEAFTGFDPTWENIFKEVVIEDDGLSKKLSEHAKNQEWTEILQLISQNWQKIRYENLVGVFAGLYMGYNIGNYANSIKDTLGIPVPNAIVMATVIPAVTALSTYLFNRGGNALRGTLADHFSASSEVDIAHEGIARAATEAKKRADDLVPKPINAIPKPLGEELTPLN